MIAFAPIGGTRVRAVRAWDAVPYPEQAAPPAAHQPPMGRPRGPRKLAPYTRAIQQARRAGAPIDQLALAYGVNRKTVRAFLAWLDTPQQEEPC